MMYSGRKKLDDLYIILWRADAAKKRSKSMFFCDEIRTCMRKCMSVSMEERARQILEQEIQSFWGPINMQIRQI